MPTAKTVPISLDLNTGIISPDPSTRIQSFTTPFNCTMTNYITTTNLAFEFGPHYSLKLEFIDHALNDIYSENLITATLASLIPDNTTCLTFNPNAINLILTGIIDKL